jgi:photosystem II stability/assembly factor-like uncharacterized protein
MKKLTFLLGVYLLALSNAAWAEPTFLIRIDQVDQAAIHRIMQTEIEVYAKTGEFWIAGADQTDLKLLTREGIALQVLDQEPLTGDHYLVWPRPGENIEPYLPEIRAKCQVLMTETDVALVKGNPRRIEELASSGFSLRKIHKRPLPLLPAGHLPPYIRSLAREYNPLIDSMINRVDQTQLLAWIDDLSGEDTVLIGGAVDSIKTRYSYSEGLPKAAAYLQERFEGLGLSVELDTFQLSNPLGMFWDITCSPHAQKAWSVAPWTGILRTTDGGDSWNVAQGSENLQLLGICRVDDDTLWAVGEGGVILRSTDGGDTWESRSKPEFAGLRFSDCHFDGASSGWVVGWEMILFTFDGGENWTEQAHHPLVKFHSIDFVDQCNGWVVGSKETIYHTSDGGATWSCQHYTGSLYELTGIDFVDSLRGWAAGTAGRGLYTTDGGASWIQRDIPTSAIALMGIEFADSLRGWAVGTDGAILHTPDFGLTWIPQGSFANHFYGLDFSDTAAGWVSGNGIIIKTTDGGETWVSAYRVDPLDLVNLVVTIEGMSYPGRQVLLTAHYDAMSEDPYHLAPGADDNASGTVSLLVAASILKDYHFLNTVKFIAFSAEEQGLVGSAAYAEDAYSCGDTILGVFNFDMIAYDGNGDRVMEVHCGYPAENQALGDILIGVITDYGVNLVPEKLIADASWGSDHASFWDWEFTAVSGGEDHQDFNPYYHTTSDRVSAFDTAYYVDFTRAAVASIATLGGPFILGDANGDLVIDLGDAVYLLNYLFKSQPPPDPLEAGDANCDGVVDVGDVIYLLNYLFKGGLAPEC